MTRSKSIRGITTALAAVMLAGVIPGVAFAQSERGNSRQNPRNEQRPDRDRSSGRPQNREDARNREERNQNRDRNQNWDRNQDRDNNWRRDDDRDRDRNRDQRWRQNQDHDRDWNRDRDNRRDWDWDRNNPRNPGWDSRDDNRWRRTDEDDHRQETKNNWRNLAIAAGGVAAYGILKNDPTIAFAGAAGALYSLNRYEQDRKSQSEADRARASVFSQPYIYRDGQRYERRLITKNGQRYYRFERP